MPTSEAFPMRRRPQTGRAHHTVDSIVAAAEEQLVAKPFAAFNTNSVAERAGVSVGSLYQYFSSKEAIVAEIRLRAAVRLQRELTSALELTQGQPVERIVQNLVRANIDAVAANAPLHALLSGELCDVGVVPEFETRAALAAATELGEDGLQNALRALAADEYGDRDAWPIVLGAWGLLRVMTTIALIEGRLSLAPDALEAEVTAAILHYIDSRLSHRARLSE